MQIDKSCKKKYSISSSYQKVALLSHKLPVLFWHVINFNMTILEHDLQKQK